MTREAILKELELWPLWTLRQPLPEQLASSDETVEESNEAIAEEQPPASEVNTTVSEKIELDNKIHPVGDLEEKNSADVSTHQVNIAVTESIQAPIADDVFAMVDTEGKIDTSRMRFQLFQSADSQCLMVHENAPFNESQSQLWQNILNAMRLKMTFVAENVEVNALLSERKPKVILLFGEKVAQTILHEPRDIIELRKQKFHHRAIPCVVSFDLQHLLQHGQDKAKAWADLCAVLALLKHEQDA